MKNSGIAHCLTRQWFRRQLSLALLPLMPLAGVFRWITAVRRSLYRCGALPSYRLPVPVVVVGNLTVGGSGKTPLVLWLVEQLCEQGWRPGIISRGYGGKNEKSREVVPASNPAVVGDEPLLLFRRSNVPVFIGRDRVAAGQALLAAYPDCNVIVSDDGLQHYRLQRSVEIVVFDGRAAGNQFLLPAGPLREPLSRLTEVTAVVWNSAGDGQAKRMKEKINLPQYEMHLVGGDFFSLVDVRVRVKVGDLRGKRLYAIAGIGDPKRFFSQLTAMGLAFDAHPFPDHFAYSEESLAFARDGVLLMTEKDAVKCAALKLGEAWVLPVVAHIDPPPQGPTLLATILEKINGRPPA